MFRNRSEAGKQLAKELLHYRTTDALVLALPRGGVIVGREVADALSLPLDIIVVRKVGHPHDPEYALCAVDERDAIVCDDDACRSVDYTWLEKAISAERREAARRAAVYRKGQEPLSLSGKTVLIVDDGIATGLSMRLAVQLVRAQKPSRIVVAVPVASQEAVQVLFPLVDELIVLIPPLEFSGAIGMYYLNFEQVDDSEVIRLLS